MNYYLRTSEKVIALRSDLLPDRAVHAFKSSTGEAEVVTEF